MQLLDEGDDKMNNVQNWSWNKIMQLIEEGDKKNDFHMEMKEKKYFWHLCKNKSL